MGIELKYSLYRQMNEIEAVAGRDDADQKCLWETMRALQGNVREEVSPVARNMSQAGVDTEPGQDQEGSCICGL